MTGSAGAPAFGAFGVSGLALALPIEAVREVVPLRELTPLPCAAPAVIGAIDLRGVLLPVLDLAQLLAQSVHSGGCVVVMLHAGQLLGLRVDSVGGLFDAVPGSVTRLNTAPGAGAVHAGSLRRSDSDSLLSLLSPAGLCALPGIPLLVDPEPERSGLAAEAAPGPAPAAPSQLLLLSAGGLPLAIHAMAVHATLADPPIEPSPLAHGLCRGVTPFCGQRIPVIDLLALCGLGVQAAPGARQSFVLRTAAGLVCLLVGQVIDVVNADHAQQLALADSATPPSGLIRGLLPATALPAGVRARAPNADGHYLLLDADALRTAPGLTGFAAAAAAACAGDPAEGERDFFSARADDACVQSLLVYQICGQAASPVEQIREILPWRRDVLQLTGQGPLRALLVNRGQSVPVLDLAELLGAPPVELGRDACVLLVEHLGMAVGFAVPRLHAIECATWQGSQAGHALPAHADAAARELATRRLVRIDSGSDARLLRVLDLAGMAAAWLQCSNTIPASASPLPCRI
ncbi:MAG: chemotaxis protein CheW [Pseudomonadota bacterium]|nr:chemotaxis protein CheW [Pseudomonadota bacterium]